MERTFLGRYQALRLLGEGGMGRAYLARQLDLGRQVVVKVMHDHIAADPKFRERFQREALLMARFQHPYAVALYDASLDDPQGPCIIMEYVRGISLEKLLEANKGRLSPGRVERLLNQLCEVLQAAHDQGIIHRDLKPTNLMVLEPDTPYEKIKVMDFGLAKLIDGPNLKKISAPGTGYPLGTPRYLCPEQARGEPMDHRGDLYSVGIILYEMLTGKFPFQGTFPVDIMLAHSAENPRSFAEVGAAEWVPPAVEAVVMACLAKDPGQRPQSARELAQLFLAALEHPEAQPETAMPPGASPAPPPLGDMDFDQKTVDANAVIYLMEAWMPEAIAEYKLRGFVQDVGGEVVESVPGLVRVRLGAPGTVYQVKTGLFSWLTRRGKSGLIEVYLRLQAADPNRQNQLKITVLMHSLDGETLDNMNFRARCTRIYGDLRGYLMGQSLEEPEGG